MSRDRFELGDRTSRGSEQVIGAVIVILSPPTGLTHYELHAPLMVLAQRQYAKGAISRTDMEALLTESSDNLEKAIAMLKFEPELSLEGKIHAVSLQFYLHFTGPVLEKHSADGWQIR